MLGQLPAQHQARHGWDGMGELALFSWDALGQPALFPYSETFFLPCQKFTAQLYKSPFG